MAIHIRRRQFLVTLAAASAAWPLAARAQHSERIPRIGIVDDAPMWHSFRKALRKLGYVEGQSVNYDYRYSEGVPDRLATAVGELVRRQVDLIAAYGTAPTDAAKVATTTIPILMPALPIQ
jgi:putative ABC transport system substrate-binding protein